MNSQSERGNESSASEHENRFFEGIRLQEEDVKRYCKNLRVMVNNFKGSRSIKTTENLKSAIDRFHLIGALVLKTTEEPAEDFQNCRGFVLAMLMGDDKNLKVLTHQEALKLHKLCTHMISLVRDNSYRVQESGIYFDQVTADIYDISRGHREYTRYRDFVE